MCFRNKRESSRIHKLRKRSASGGPQRADGVPGGRELDTEAEGREEGAAGGTAGHPLEIASCREGERREEVPSNVEAP